MRIEDARIHLFDTGENALAILVGELRRTPRKHTRQVVGHRPCGERPADFIEHPRLRRAEQPHRLRGVFVAPAADVSAIS